MNSDFENHCNYLIEFYLDENPSNYLEYSAVCLKNTFSFLSSFDINNIFHNPSFDNHSLLKTVI